MTVFRLDNRLCFPDIELAEADGLLAIGGDLSPPRLLLAYSHGIFPWYLSGDPVLWWSPDPRAVFLPGQTPVHRRLIRTMRDDYWRISFDRCCGRVIRCCGEGRGGGGTWITPEMEAAYGELHRLGYVHSVECWYGEELVGGLYGVSLGKIFYGESMFSRRRDASKIVLAVLLRQLFNAGYRLFDCQFPTPHLLSLGAVTLSRRCFTAELRAAGTAGRPSCAAGWFPCEDVQPQALEWR